MMKNRPNPSKNPYIRSPVPSKKEDTPRGASPLMDREDEQNDASWYEDFDRLIRLGAITAAFFFLIAILAAIGEIRGWWGLIGELGMTIGTVAGIIVSATTLLAAATRDQATSIVDSNQHILAISQEHSQTLTAMDIKLEKLETLDTIENAITGEAGMISELDSIQLELDRQTGVLDQQLNVLREIQTSL